MRFSKSTSRGLTKTGWVCESTNPGRTTLSAQSISSDSFAMLLQPGIAQSILRRADGDNFPAKAQDCPIFDDAQFLQVRTATWASICCARAQRKELSDVDQEERSRRLLVLSCGVWSR